VVYQELMGVFSSSTTYFVGKRALPFGVGSCSDTK
jgi:hypothetical protein